MSPILSFTPEELVQNKEIKGKPIPLSKGYNTTGESSDDQNEVTETTEDSLDNNSEDYSIKSIIDFKQCDSGVGSSNERTATSTVSVLEGIRKFEEIHQSESNLHKRNVSQNKRSSQVGSIDSLLGLVTDEPPALPERSRFKSENRLIPPPLPAKRTSMSYKKVTYTEDLDEYNTDNQIQEDGNIKEEIPTLPSVKELATKFQVKQSPEPKPRKSFIKVM